jgi:peptide chain release factor 2
MLDANFWQDKDNSKKVIKEKKLYEELVNSLNQSFQKLNDFDDLNELALEERNLAVQEETLQNIKDLKKEVKKNEINQTKQTL